MSLADPRQSAGKPAVTPRNIVLITTDQERYFDRDPAPLPARERLRRRGTTFERFYGASVECSPARSVIYTGHHAPTTRVIDNVGHPSQADLSTELATVGHRLRDLGYYTAYKGKWHLSRTVWPRDVRAFLGEASAGDDETTVVDALEPYGFSDYSPGGDQLGRPYEGFQGDDVVASDSLHWLKTEGRRLEAEGRSWFLAVNFVNPHDVMFAAFGGGARPGGFTGPPPSSFYGETWELPVEPSRQDAIDGPGRPAAHHEFSQVMTQLVGPRAVDDESLRRFWSYYVNCLRDVDSAILRLLDGMEQLGLVDRTAIVFTSDHGELAGAHGLFGKGPCSYDENIRLPLVVVDPDVPGGARTEVISSQVDLAPTILSLAGASEGHPTRTGLPGRDLRGELGIETHRDASRSGALFAYSGLWFLDSVWARHTVENYRGGTAAPAQRDWSKRGHMRSLVTGRYKFSRYFSPLDYVTPSSFEELTGCSTLELFDLETDPSERLNLAVSPAGEARELIEQLNVELQRLIEVEIGDDTVGALPTPPDAPWVRE